MKIINGNFGTKGSAYISRDNFLVIEGAQKSIHAPDQIASVTASTIQDKKFTIVGFIIGSLVLGSILFVFLNVFGLVIGIVAAWFGAKHSGNKSDIVEVKFTDNKSVFLECTPRGFKKLTRFGPG